MRTPGSTVSLGSTCQKQKPGVIQAQREQQVIYLSIKGGNGKSVVFCLIAGGGKISEGSKKLNLYFGKVI